MAMRTLPPGMIALSPSAGDWLVLLSGRDQRRVLRVAKERANADGRERLEQEDIVVARVACGLENAPVYRAECEENVDDRTG